MIGKFQPWRAVPAEPLVSLLPRLLWKEEEDASASVNAAALILYVALNFAAMPVNVDDDTNIMCWSAPTYDELETLTGLSRAIVADGLKRLIKLGLIESDGPRHRRMYGIVRGGRRWFKLPCRALVENNRIVPLRQMTLRTKLDLQALKLYLYFASIRDGRVAFSMASHDTITDKIGIPAADIRRAHSLLTSVGLLSGIEREHANQTEKKNEPNKYYLRGYEALMQVPSTAA